MPPTKPHLTVQFVLERETKGAVRYAEVDASGKPIADIHDAKIGILYLRKNALPNQAPRALTVSISFG